MRKAAADESKSKEAFQTAYELSQQELNSRESVVVGVCKRLEDKEARSGSLLVSRVQALGDYMDFRVRDALLLGVKKALGVVSTHYQISLPDVATGYVVQQDLSDDEALATIDLADAAAAETAETLASIFEGELFPDAGEDGGVDPPAP